MALSSAFRERLELMEHSRNQRISLLQAEKEWQANKSQVLEWKHANIRAMEQRCLVFDQKIAADNFKISALKSEIESLDAKYCTDSQQLRILRREVEELGELEKERDKFYELKICEMKEFSESVKKFLVECRMCIEELRNCKKEQQSTITNLQGNNKYFSNSEIAAAEMRKSELMAVKESLDKSMASSYRLRAQLQKQLQNM
ncbi:uncharacterized protein LOC121266987 isoform X1 [Juglans microcarpa x Juglans regia]|uniref:uncharacterized protein LOC121266987 isoform X1 n=1 Tax=Juglans microcarpa x Juglans regia TaxID=2249226 RepID=UPI001B7ED82A|nr:uncharacterized protein LOC121266987 isoform X1 [Juglans microcarpa x Juglans regia]